MIKVVAHLNGKTRYAITNQRREGNNGVSTSSNRVIPRKIPLFLPQNGTESFEFSGITEI